MSTTDSNRTSSFSALPTVGGALVGLYIFQDEPWYAMVGYGLVTGVFLSLGAALLWILTETGVRSVWQKQEVATPLVTEQSHPGVVGALLAMLFLYGFAQYQARDAREQFAACVAELAPSDRIALVRDIDEKTIKNALLARDRDCAQSNAASSTDDE